MKILQKHQAGEGSVDSRAEGAVTTNQDVGHRKLVKGGQVGACTFRPFHFHKESKLKNQKCKP